MPKISLVVPTYNRPALLSRAISSVLRQSEADFEVVVVNDAGNKEAGDVVSGFRDARVEYVERSVNGGLAAARNTGIKAAKGQYVTLLDDDDELLPEFLGKMSRALTKANHPIGFAWCSIQVVKDTPEGEHPVRTKTWNPDTNDAEVAIGIGAGYGLTIHRNCFDEIGMFDESFRVLEDTEFLFRLATRFPFFVLPEVLVKIHEHGNSRLSKASPEKARALEIIMERNAKYLSQHKRLAAYYARKVGLIYYSLGNREQGRKFMRDSLYRNTMDLNSWRALVLHEVLRGGK